jgi:hypothetical protein
MMIAWFLVATPELFCQSIMERVKLNLKYSFECEARDLFLALSKPNHLKNWIAPRVLFDGETGVYTFFWGKSSDSARIMEQVSNRFLKWEWVGGDRHPGEYVSFRIVSPPGDSLIDLYVEDFCDQDEEKILHAGWDKQMERLATLLH